MAVTPQLRSKALIGGKWVARQGGTTSVRSPFSGEVVNEVSSCDVDYLATAWRVGGVVNRSRPAGR